MPGGVFEALQSELLLARKRRSLAGAFAPSSASAPTTARATGAETRPAPLL
jgi:hypothetical protein